MQDGHMYMSLHQSFRWTLCQAHALDERYSISLHFKISINTFRILNLIHPYLILRQMNLEQLVLQLFDLTPRPVSFVVESRQGVLHIADRLRSTTTKTFRIDDAFDHSRCHRTAPSLAEAKIDAASKRYRRSRRQSQSDITGNIAGRGLCLATSQ